MKNAPVITIDGPSGTGKGTILRLLAKELGWHALDSGAIYRAIAWAIMRHHVDMEDTAALQHLLQTTNIQLLAHSPAEPTRVYCNAEDITEAIRTEAVGMVASKSSALPEVRQAILQLQRDFQQPPGLVADGRDMGTVVFPHAQLKIYLDAEPMERINRRFKQLQEKGQAPNFEFVKQELLARDQQDSSRQLAPLVAAADAHHIDTTELTIEQVFAKVMAYVRQFVL